MSPVPFDFPDALPPSPDSVEKVILVALLEYRTEVAPSVGAGRVVSPGPVPILALENAAALELRVVVLDDQRKRLPIFGRASVTTTTSRCSMWDAEATGRTPAFIGVEQITPDGKKKLAAQAIDKLSKLGVNIGYPEEGKAFEFAFKGADGKLVRLADFKGDVVYIHWWASW